MRRNLITSRIIINIVERARHEPKSLYTSTNMLSRYRFISFSFFLFFFSFFGETYFFTREESSIIDYLRRAMRYTTILWDHREEDYRPIESRGGLASVPFVLFLSRQRCLSYLNGLLLMRARIGRYLRGSLRLCYADSRG